MFVNSQVKKSQENIDNEVLKYLIEKGHIESDIKNYATIPLFPDEKDNFNIFLIRIGCSKCKDYLLFRNENEFKIMESIDLKSIISSINYFTINFSNEEILNYTEKLIEIHKDNLKVNNKIYKSVKIKKRV